MLFVRANLAPELATIRENMSSVSLRDGWGGNTGTAMMPAFKQAKNATTKSSDGGNTSTALWHENKSMWSLI